MSAQWNIPPPTYDAHSTTTSYMTTLTPYLQLPHLLSLTWLAYPILSLIFVAFRLQGSLADAQKSIVNAKSDLLASCKAAEEAATATASLPRYIALATNKQFAEAVNGSMNAARAALVLSLTVMEAIINFIIDLYRSTLLCFLELVVRGGLAIIIGAVREVNELLGNVASGLRTSIQNDIGSANNIIRGAIDAINRINPFADIQAPQIAVPSLDGLQNVQLPPSFEEALTRLNSSLPSVEDLKGKVEDIINTPFELLKKDINDTFAGLSFEPEGMPVPEQNRLSFCSDMDMSVIDDIGRDFIKTAKIGIVILVLVALLLIGLNCLLTWYKWRCMKNHLEYTRQAWLTDPTLVHAKGSTSAPQITLSDHNMLILQANSEHPLVTRITNQCASRLRLTPSQHIHIQWFFNYIFHAPALACFLIGFFGILCIEIQLLAMGPLVTKYQGRAAGAVSDFSETIASSINSSMYNQSAAYANEVNARVDGMQTSINEGVFGWVNGTTTTLNTTINDFYSDVQNAVATVFNGTILEGPANEFLRCFIGTKVDAIENALTFLHDNLHVDMPRVNQTALILSQESVDEASKPIAAAAIGGGQDDDQGLIGRLVLAYAESLKKERVTFAVFLALWGVVILMGLCVVFYHSFGRPYLDQRARRKYETEQRGGADLFGKSDSGNNDYLPSVRRSVFKPFWADASRSPSPDNRSNSIPEKSTEVLNPPVVATKTNRILSALKRKERKGMGREQLKTDDEAARETPLSPISEPVSPNHRNTAWYGKMGALLVRKGKDPTDKDSIDFWDASGMKKDEEAAAPPKLHVYTQRGIDKYGPPPRQSQQLRDAEARRQREERNQERSRWSSSPDERQTNWFQVMSPTKMVQPTPTPTVIVSEEPENLAYNDKVSSTDPNPLYIGLPIRKTRTADIPLDVGPMYEDPFMSPPPNARHAPPAAMPVPLHASFDREPQSISAPPRHPDLQHIYHPSSARRPRQDSSPPPPLKSPKMNYQTPLAPPPHRHSRSASTGTTTWRVTNAVPGESAFHSPASSAKSARSGSSKHGKGSVSRSLDTGAGQVHLSVTTHARQSSSVNPFITPFDDEHRVKIDHPVEQELRKSMQTNPFATAL